MLEGHRLKMMGALMLPALGAAQPGVAGRVAAMPDLAGVISSAAQQAGDANVAKQRGLYADLLAGGELSLPSDVTEAEAAEAVARAREVGASAALLHDQDALAKFAEPPAGTLDLAAVVFGRYLDMDVADADAAAAALTGMASWLQDADPPQE
jgi:microcystin-dependent protein